MELIGKTPQELDQMTLSEIAVAAIDPQEGVSGETMSMMEVDGYLQWWRNATPEEKLLYG